MSLLRLRPRLSRNFKSHNILRSISISSSVRHVAQPISWTPSCPSPTCSCAPTPELPSDLPIDRKAPLLNTMANYAEHVVVFTGKDDWSSRIEDERGYGAADFLHNLKSVVGRGGEAFDPFNNIMITTSSFAASPDPDTTTALLFPSFKRITIPNDRKTVSALSSAYLKARTLHSSHNVLNKEGRAALMRDESAKEGLPSAVEEERVTVLICGHGGRDMRCGILGPVLRDEFSAQLRRKGFSIASGGSVHTTSTSTSTPDAKMAQVGLISHIGGHKYAGNIIIYIPPSMTSNPLAGCGIWYGRVGPEQVEGIVSETVLGGKIIKDLLRGGITQEGENLGRMLEAQEGFVEKSEGLRLKPRARG